MISFGIDQSYTSTGWCVLKDNKPIAYGLINSNPSEQMHMRARSIALQLRELLLAYKPDQVRMEGLGYGSFGNATRDLAGLQYVIMALNPDVAFQLIAPTSLKRQATGSGRAKKEEMWKALPISAQFAFESVAKSKGRYDLTDAYWLASHQVQERL